MNPPLCRPELNRYLLVDASVRSQSRGSQLLALLISKKVNRSIDIFSAMLQCHCAVQEEVSISQTALPPRSDRRIKTFAPKYTRRHAHARREHTHVYARMHTHAHTQVHIHVYAHTHMLGDIVMQSQTGSHFSEATLRAHILWWAHGDLFREALLGAKIWRKMNQQEHANSKMVPSAAPIQSRMNASVTLSADMTVSSVCQERGSARGGRRPLRKMNNEENNL